MLIKEYVTVQYLWISSPRRTSQRNVRNRIHSVGLLHHKGYATPLNQTRRKTQKRKTQRRCAPISVLVRNVSSSNAKHPKIRNPSCETKPVLTWCQMPSLTRCWRDRCTVRVDRQTPLEVEDIQSLKHNSSSSSSSHNLY